MKEKVLENELKDVNGGAKTGTCKYECNFTFIIKSENDEAECKILDYLGDQTYYVQIKRKSMNAPIYQKMSEQVIDLIVGGSEPKAFI